MVPRAASAKFGATVAKKATAKTRTPTKAVSRKVKKTAAKPAPVTRAAKARQKKIAQASK